MFLMQSKQFIVKRETFENVVPYIAFKSFFFSFKLQGDITFSTVKYQLILAGIIT